MTNRFTFFNKDEIKDEFNAKGPKEAKKQLDVMKLSVEERKKYNNYIEQLRYERSLIVSNFKVGEISKAQDIANNLLKLGVTIDIIISSTGLTKEQLRIIHEHLEKDI